MRRFLAFFLLLCTVCLSHASADGYSELIPGSIVSNILDESISFFSEPNPKSNPVGTLGAGVSMRLLSLEPEGWRTFVWREEAKEERATSGRMRS